MIISNFIQITASKYTFFNYKQFKHFYCKMGSSNCKSFSPNKSAANAKPKTSPKREEANNDEYIEGIVCQENEIKENEMKTFDLGEGKVLLVKQNGELNALGNKCTHYGAPLVGGALGDGRVRCQWHGACFNIKTGDIEDFPGFDSLPCYKVTVENGNVKVRAKKSELETSKRVRNMVGRSCSDTNTYVVVGGGPSGAICVETLRQEGFAGKIVMVCKENCLPYDRIKVSKTFDLDITKVQFRTPEFYKTNSIDVLTDVEATQLNTSEKTIALNNGQSIKYTKCYIATGSTPRLPNIEGIMMKNIFTLRTYEDSQAIFKQVASDKHLVVLGSSFIGLEAAAYCVGKVAEITVVGRDSAPLKAVFGEQIGARVQQMFEEKGVHFAMNSGINKFLGENGTVTSVELKDGTTLRADICIVGTGSTLNTNFLQNSGVEIKSNGSIPVDNRMETNVSGVYAGGDIAFAPVYSSNNEQATIGHFPLAHYHGRIAALNMIGKSTESKAVPFFWTMLFGKSIRYAGHGVPDDILIDGNLKELNFVAFHFKNDRVIAMASCQRDPLVAKYAELLSQGKHLTKSEVTKDPLYWVN